MYQERILADHRITERSGWQGPLWVIWSNPLPTQGHLALSVLFAVSEAVPGGCVCGDPRERCLGHSLPAGRPGAARRARRSRTTEPHDRAARRSCTTEPHDGATRRSRMTEPHGRAARWSRTTEPHNRTKWQSRTTELHDRTTRQSRTTEPHDGAA